VTPAPLPAMPSWATLVRADNPGPMTLEGTNTYVLHAAGADLGVVVDPGPLDEDHLEAVQRVAPVGLVLLTHGHPDHSDGAFALQEMTGAPLAAVDPHFCVDADPLAAGAVLTGVGGVEVRVLATPGHTGGHCSFLVDGVLVSGDALVTGHPTSTQRGPQLLHPVFNHDQRNCVRSLGALAMLETEVLIPGHGEVWRGPIRALAERAARTR